MSLVNAWTDVERDLDPSWAEAGLRLTLADESDTARALALLGSAGPGRSGRTIRFAATRGGVGVGPEAVRRMLRRLDDEQIAGTLELVSSTAADAVAAPARRSLAADWDAELATLPADWSDLYCELELTSTDHLDQAALLTSPLNPLRYGEVAGFRFRSARRFGYGASPAMVQRSLERLDEEDIPGRVRVLRALCDTHPVGTQGPVWQVGGRTV